jgi:hypothetical protein
MTDRLTRRVALLKGAGLLAAGLGLGAWRLYFPDRITDAVHRRSPYNTRGARTTRNANDRLYGDGGSRLLLRLRKDAKGGYLGTLTMGVAA